MTAFSYSGTELDALASAPNYYRFIARRFAPHVGARAVEVGAGIGTFTEHLLRETPVREVVAVEPAENNFPLLRERLAGRPNVRLLHGYLEQVADEVRGADSVVAVNVLEHTPDDLAFLRAARGVLRPGGSVLLFVPAMPAIFGSLDHEFEHYRRYDKASLARALEGAGFRDARLRHVNSLGILAWFAAGRIFRWRTIHASRVALYDRLVVPWLTALESRLEPPAGQSILAVATA
jgi:SAM-dependent methyltransferase